MTRELAFECLVSPYGVDRAIDWSQEFQREAPLELEIGFGHGDFLLRQAEENPGVNFIGIEQEWERVKRTLRKVVLAQAQHPRRERISNVRLMQMDAVVGLERLFHPQTLMRVYCLFPCPWPKKKHIKYRLFSPDFLRLLNSRLVSGGEALLVTDAHPYFAWVLEQLDGAGFRYEQRVIKPQYDTKYERKWSAQGQKEFYELRLRKEHHIAIALKEDVPLRVYIAKDFFPDRFEFKDLLGETSILHKEILFDEERQKAMVRLVVSEKPLTQQIWIGILRGVKGWSIAKSQGCPIIPTAGIAQAIFLVAQAVARTGSGEFWATDESATEGEETFF